MIATFQPKQATPKQAELVKYWNEKLESSSPETILRWAVTTFAPKLTMGTALGSSGCVILSILARIETKIPVFNLDTGYQFPETLELLDRISTKYGIEITRRSAEISVAEYEAVHGGPLYRIDPDRCCYDRKIRVLESIAPNYDAWISGLRRDQGPTRAKTPVIGWDARFGLIKIAPLALWTNKEVWDIIVKESIPYNTLYDRGYKSIGCAPCTRPTLPDEDERAGRWSGQLKTECGLHQVNESLTTAQL
ncbi:MAG: phosphoadenylyl-sulfate reductase [Planctomycetaceae bacterium]|jgi:phosphoadenosine phosphosulfate reductase|nr:phosphoadenylyl-sulfate reductase [Planctomycetaceae bacterium]